MKIDEYLFRKKLTHKQFAQKIDCAPNHLSGYIKGRYRISKKLAKYIERETDGMVSASEALEANPPLKKLDKKTV